MSASNDVLGTVQPDGTLQLDQKLTVPPGRVKVRVESVEPRSQPKEGLIEFLRRTHAELEAAGHKFMTGEEATAWADDDRIEEAYRQAEEAKRQQEPKG